MRLTSAKPSQSVQLLRHWGAWIAPLLVAALLCVTFLYWKREVAREDAEREQIFNQATEQISRRLEDRLAFFELVLRGIKGFYEGSDEVSREEYSEYVKALRLSEMQTGLQGVQVVLRIAPSDVPIHLQEQRNKGFADYQIRPLRESPPYHAPIILIEPYDLNIKALGFDIASNPMIAQALDAAKDSGNVAITGRLQLVQDTDTPQPAVVMYAPMYRKNQRLQTVADRQSAIEGWVGVPFRIDDIISSLKIAPEAGIGLEIYDGPALSSTALMSGPMPMPATDDGLTTRRTVKMGGQEWSLVFHSFPAFEAQFNGRQNNTLIALLGIGFSLLVGGLVHVLASRRERAEAMAHEMTRELRVIQADMEATLTAMPDLLLEVGLDGKYYKYRTSQQDVFAGPASFYVGKLITDVLPAAAAATAMETLQEAHETGVSLGKQVEIPVNNKPRWFEISAARKEAGTDDVPRFVLISRDITDRRDAQMALQKSLEQLQLLETCISRLDDIVLITEAEPVDAPGPRIVFVNDAFERRTGYTRAEILGHSPRILQGILTQRDALRRIRMALAQWKPVREELINYTKTGEPFWVELDIVAVANDAGWYTHWVAVGRDITERKLTEAKLRLSAQVFESSSDGIVITDSHNLIVSVNPSYSAITGYSLDEVLGKNPGFLKADRHGDTPYAEMWQSIQKAGHWAGEVWNRRKNGENYPEWLSITAVKDAQGNVVQHIGILSDLSAKKEALKHIDFLAHYDTLTRLPNHKLLQDRTMLALATAQRTQSHVSLMFIDIDHFQNVNDSLGRPVGNEILKVMAARLTAHLQADDTVCRQGGDEFIVLLPHTDAQGAAHVATRTLALMREPVVLENGQELNLTASIGIAVYPDNGDEFDRLSQYADAALLRAKQDGRNNFKFFNEQMHDSAREVLQIENQLRRALSKGELLLHYQPQVDAVTMQIIGAEALIRWQHPEWGMVSPARFIPIAENSGQILEIGDWVLRTALQQIADWRAAGVAVVPVAVNLSALQFRQTSLCDTVSQALRDFNVPPQLLELELTERIAMEDSGFTLDQISKLHAMGITLSIDDFGTGYSSLSYLRRYQIDKLKIDQSFVQDLGRETDSGTIVRAIINMAHGMGFKTIAEGVETQAQLDYLRQHGCDEIQGYFFSRPVPAADFERLLSPASA